MCEQCNSLNTTEAENQELTMTDEELLGLLNQGKEKTNELTFFREPLELDDNEMTDIVKTKAFLEGQNIGAKLVGLYSTLVNFGVDIETACTLVINQHAIDSNEKISIINSDMNIEVSKNQCVQVDKNSL